MIIIVANFSKTNELETRAARQRSAYLANKWVYFGTKCDSWIFIDIVMIISRGVSESKAMEVHAPAARRAPDALRSLIRMYIHPFSVCVKSLIFSMAQITLLKIFYIFTFYLVECNTKFYLRAKPTTTLSLFLCKVQCFIPPVAGGPCYLCVQWSDACARCVYWRPDRLTTLLTFGDTLLFDKLLTCYITTPTL